MREIYVVTVTDKISDCSWSWAFSHWPSPEDINKVVAAFVAKWERTKDVISCYTEFRGYTSKGFGPETHAVEIGKHDGNVFLKLTKVELVDNA